MGIAVGVKDTGGLADLISYDGREFGWMHENLRDSILNGAKNVEFGIIGLRGLREDPSPRIAKGTIADDGDGMAESILRNVYFWVTATGTPNTFDVCIDSEKKSVLVKAVPIVGTPDKRHARRGIGGRVTLSRWNPLGIMTITFQGGVARQVQMFRTIEGKIEMRQWYNDGYTTPIRDVYNEPAYLDYDEVHADRPFMRRLLIAADLAETETQADDIIDAMEPDDTLPNPLHGFNWRDEVPEWIGVYDEDKGMWAAPDGGPAHGTIKILLGTKVTDSTALTGDPNFPNEADADKRNGAINESWLDLSSWNVRVWAIEKVRPRKTSFELVGHKGRYSLDEGQPNNKTLPTGRPQLGSLAYRLGDPDALLHTESVKLGKYGTAFVVVVDPAKAGATFGATSRHGTISFVYGNELHGISESGKLTPADYQYRNMGIPTLATIEFTTMESEKGKDGKVVKDKDGKTIRVPKTKTDELYKYVSVYIVPPLATDTTEGVHQPLARDTLKWSGKDKMPMGGDDGINAAVRNGLSDDFWALFAAASGVTAKTSVPQHRYKHLRKLAAKAAEGEPAAPSTSAPAAPGTKPALVEDPTGEHTGTKIEPTRPSGPHVTHRDPCPECGQVGPHAEGCTRKEARTPGGPFVKLDPDEKGRLTGRTSKAKSGSPTPPPVSVEILPPRVEFKDTPTVHNDAGDPAPEFPVAWEITGRLEPNADGEVETGVIYVYRHHLSVQMCFTAGRDPKRSEADVEEAVKGFIERGLADGLVSMLSTAELNLNAGKKPEKKLSLAVTVAQIGSSPVNWLLLVNSLSADEKAVKDYVRAHAALKRGKRTAGGTAAA